MQMLSSFLAQIWIVAVDVLISNVPKLEAVTLIREPYLRPPKIQEDDNKEGNYILEIMVSITKG